MNTSFVVENGKLVEYRGEKNFYVQRSGDVVSEITDYYTGNIQEVTVPGYIRTVGSLAFSGSSCLEKLVLETGLEVLEKGAFWYCDSLKEIYFPQSLKSVSPDAFPIGNKVTVHVDYVAGVWTHLKKTNWLIRKVPRDIYDRYSGVLIAMKLAYKRAINLVLHIKSDVQDFEFKHFPADCRVVMEEDIATAGRIFQCSEISKVTIGKNVRFLHPDVFSGGAEYFEDTSLEEISVDPQNQNYFSVDGVLFNANNELLRFPQMKLMDKNTYYVPVGTTVICDGAFSWAYGLEYVYLPPCVELRSGSFANMPKLDSVYRERTEA